MNRTLLYPLLLACGLSMSACNAEPTDSPEFDLDVYYTPIGRPQVRVTSLNDAVTINQVVINDGKSKCRVMRRNDLGGEMSGTHFPLRLNYTESWLLVMTEPCRLRDITLVTDLGDAAYTFQ